MAFTCCCCIKRILESVLPILNKCLIHVLDKCHSRSSSPILDGIPANQVIAIVIHYSCLNLLMNSHSLHKWIYLIRAIASSQRDCCCIVVCNSRSDHQASIFCVGVAVHLVGQGKVKVLDI